MTEHDPPEFLTTREVAELLRVRERKVYDLAAAGEIPCRRVTGKLLFPRDEIDAWLNGGERPRTPAPRAEATPPMVVAGSHDPLLDWAIRASGSGLASFCDGSLDGLERVASGQAAAAGLHLPGEGEGGNAARVAEALAGRPFVLVALARRRQGLILAPDRADAAGLRDLRGARLVLRQPKAGARLLLERLLGEAGLGLDAFETLPEEARTEGEAAAAVASGRADAALGLETAARQQRLAFRPLAEERFDLVVHRRAWFEPPFQALTGFVASDAFAAKAGEMGGYDVEERLRVVWNG